MVERKYSESSTAAESNQKTTAESAADEKERAMKEKMLKRAEALSQLKDHMLKEIEHGRRQAEKKRQEEEEQERARQAKDKDRDETAQEIARLEEIKSETLKMLMLQEKDEMNTMEKVLKICAVSSIISKRKNRSSSSSSSSSSDGDNKKKQRRRKRSASSSSSSSSSN